MRTRYNKSKIMRLANHYMKHEGYSRSLALKLAWKEAKKSEFYLIIEKVQTRNFDFNMNNYANSLTNYYANHAYNGD